MLLFMNEVFVRTSELLVILKTVTMSLEYTFRSSPILANTFESPPLISLSSPVILSQRSISLG